MTTFKVSRMVWEEEEDDDEDSFEKSWWHKYREEIFFPSYSNFLASETFGGDGRFFKSWAQSLRNSKKKKKT